MKKKLLVIDKNQFGRIIDSYKWCEHLHNEYNIYYLSIDYNYQRTCNNNINLIYVPYTKNKILRGMLFFLYAITLCIIFPGFIFIIYFPHCSIIKRVAFWRAIHVDVRTLSVSVDKDYRERSDALLRKEVLMFNSASFISKGIMKKMKIELSDTKYLLPLGADPIARKFLNVNGAINLLYVGTLYNRRVIDTVKGVDIFKKRHPEKEIHYIIIGDGEEYDALKKYVTENRLEELIKLKGRLLYDELAPYFEWANIGVSYIPITDYYQYQPPTKTFEYIISGLYTIATKTEANIEIINENCGCLIDDTPDSFADSLEYVDTIINKLDKNTISQTHEEYKWDAIVSNWLKPILSHVNIVVKSDNRESTRVNE